MAKSKNKLFLEYFFSFITIITIPKKLYSEQIDDVVVLKNKVEPNYKKGIGAYFIAYSPYNIGYDTITSYIDLPSSLNTNEGKRKAFISFGVEGKNGYIEMGIVNSGDGWSPYYSDNGYITVFNGYNKIPDIKIIGMQVDFYNNRKMKFYLTYRNVFMNIIKNFTTDIYAAHILEYENDKVKKRLYRFVSLVNDESNGVPDDQNDHTYMINGKFVGLCLLINGSVLCTDWVIPNNIVEECWLVSSKRIEFSYEKDNEYFSIKHYIDSSYSRYLNFNCFLLFVISFIILF